MKYKSLTKFILCSFDEHINVSIKPLRVRHSIRAESTNKKVLNLAVHYLF